MKGTKQYTDVMKSTKHLYRCYERYKTLHSCYEKNIIIFSDLVIRSFDIGGAVVSDK